MCRGKRTTRTKSPITEGGKEECDNLPKKTHVSKVEDGLLKRSGHSDSEVVKRDVTKRVAIIPSSERRSKHKSLFFGSPLHSPSYKTSPGNIPIKNDRVSGLQKSMSLSTHPLTWLPYSTVVGPSLARSQRGRTHMSQAHQHPRNPIVVVSLVGED